MPIRWRVDPKALMKECGYSSYRIRQENILGQQTLRNIDVDADVNISMSALDKICEITGKQPGKLIEHVPKSKIPSEGTDLIKSDVNQ